MTFPPSSSSAWTELGWTFLHMLWIGAGVGLAASLARRRLQNASAEIRHAVALGGLLVMTVSPFTVFALLHKPAVATLPVPTPQTTPLVRMTSEAAPPGDRGPVHPQTRIAAPAVKRGEPSSWLDHLIAWLPGVWILGSTITLTSLAAGLVGVERLRRESRPLQSGPIPERCRLLANSLGMTHALGIAVCDRIAAPMLLGVFRPLILLPTSAVTGWSFDQVEMALLHELAHLRRRDNLTSLFQRFAEALVFFHPTTWWLSAWLRLERETCCDHLVVAHTGRPRAYAELLAVLADAGPPRPAPALNERPITMRIRRILLKEDRPMSLKPTLPEALALCAATVIAVAFALPSQAESPAENSKENAKADLKRLVDAVVGLPASDATADRDRTLTSIAAAQLEIGDDAGAQASLRLVQSVTTPPAASPMEPVYERWLDDALTQARVRHDAGQTEASREMLRRLIDELFPDDPALLARAAKVLEAELADRLGRSVGVTMPDGVQTVVDVVVQEVEPNHRVQTTNPKAPIDDEAAAAARKLELLAHLLSESKDLLPREALRKNIDRLVSLGDTMETPIRANLTAGLASLCMQLNDAEHGRSLLERARKTMLALPESHERDHALVIMSTLVAKQDPTEEVLFILDSLSPDMQPIGLERALDSIRFANVGWSPESGYIGQQLAPSPVLVDQNAAAVALPRILAVAQTLPPSEPRTRLLDSIARVQAGVGNFADALDLVKTLPDLPDGNGRKPITLALIAALQAEAGDQAGADHSFAVARTLVAGLADDAAKATALTVVAEKLEKAKRLDAAREVLAVAIPTAQRLAEPRRSRLLCLLTATHARVDGVAAALPAADAIRDEPGVEKAQTFYVLANLANDQGDPETSRSLAHRSALAIAPRPDDRPTPGSSWSITAISDLVGQLDLEVPDDMTAFHRLALYRRLAALGELDDPEAAAPLTPMLPIDGGLSQKIHDVYRAEGLDAALKVADAAETPASRFRSIQELVQVVAPRRDQSIPFLHPQ